jgi:hypothetical protein
MSAKHLIFVRFKISSKLTFFDRNYFEEYQSSRYEIKKLLGKNIDFV